MHVIRGKANVLPAKKQGPTLRGALGDLNANVQAQREVNISGKVSVTTAEFEKKAGLCRPKRWVHSKIARQFLPSEQKNKIIIIIR